MTKAIDLVGDKYGRLKVISAAGRSKSGMKMWLCLCDCGSSKVFGHGDIRSGKTRSCGCLRAEKLSSMSVTHGMSKTPTYSVWLGIIARCTNQDHKDYLNYGGRGITVCERWKESFDNFYHDMGEKPDGLSIDRIDNDGAYEPSNCRWADAVMQANNRRKRSVFPDRDAKGKFVKEVA